MDDVIITSSVSDLRFTQLQLSISWYKIFQLISVGMYGPTEKYNVELEMGERERGREGGRERGREGGGERQRETQGKDSLLLVECPFFTVSYESIQRLGVL